MACTQAAPLPPGPRNSASPPAQEEHGRGGTARRAACNSHRLPRCHLSEPLARQKRGEAGTAGRSAHLAQVAVPQLAHLVGIPQEVHPSLARGVLHPDLRAAGKAGQVVSSW